MEIFQRHCYERRRILFHLLLQSDCLYSSLNYILCNSKATKTKTIASSVNEVTSFNEHCKYCRQWKATTKPKKKKKKTKMVEKISESKSKNNNTQNMIMHLYSYEWYNHVKRQLIWWCNQKPFLCSFHWVLLWLHFFIRFAWDYAQEVVFFLSSSSLLLFMPHIHLHFCRVVRLVTYVYCTMRLL